MEQKRIIRKIPEIKIISEYTPEYKTKGAACFDLRLVEPARILPGRTVFCNLGIKMEIPEGYYIELVPRSSISKLGLILHNSVGVIDCDYRGPITAALHNISRKKVNLKIGDRVIQAQLKKVIKCTFKQVDDLEETERGVGGYGSTGLN